MINKALPLQIKSSLFTKFMTILKLYWSLIYTFIWIHNYCPIVLFSQLSANQVNNLMVESLMTSPKKLYKKTNGFFFIYKQGFVTILTNFMKKKTFPKSLWSLFKDAVQLPQGQCYFDKAVYFFTTKFIEVPGTHFIYHGRMKG